MLPREVRTRLVVMDLLGYYEIWFYWFVILTGFILIKLLGEKILLNSWFLVFLEFFGGFDVFSWETCKLAFGLSDSPCQIKSFIHSYQAQLRQKLCVQETEYETELIE